MPEEVFRLWFDGRIQANGWPPVGPAWLGALRYKPFGLWQQLEWEKRMVGLDLDRFTSGARHIIHGLIQANFMGRHNVYSRTLGDSKERMAKILEYVRTRRSLPGALILLEDSGSYEIVDGSHRLAVLFFVLADGQTKDLLETDHEAWCGFLPGQQSIPR